MTLNNFSWVIPGKLAGSDLPGGGRADANALRDDVQFLADAGIGLLVSLEKPSGPIGKICREAGVQWRNFPVADFGIPEDIDSFMMLVTECIRSFEGGIPVCVHCRAGIGRTGLTLACIVGAYLGLETAKAVATVKKVRPAVETEEQRSFITLFLDTYES